MTNKIITFVFLGLLIGFMVVLLRSPAAKAPRPTMVTQERLAALKVSVLEYVEKNEALPKELSELDLGEEAMKDGLGYPFVYKVDGDSVTIVSYGSDGKPGGHTFSSDNKVAFKIPKSSASAK